MKRNIEVEIKTYDLNGARVIADKALVNAITAYRSTGFVAEGILPRVDVPNFYGFLPIIPNGEMNRIPACERAPATEATIIMYNVSTIEYRIKNYALSIPLTIEDEKNADDPWRQAESNAIFLTDGLRLAKENRAFSLIGSATNVSTVFTTGSGWATGGDPVATINTMFNQVKDSTGYRPTRVVFGGKAFQTFSTNSAVTRVFGGMATPDKVQDFFRVEQVLVSGAYWNSALAGPVAPHAFFDDAVFACVQPPEGAARYWPRYGVSPTWSPRGVPGPYIPQIFFSRKTESQMTEVMVYEGETVVDKNLGVMLTGTNSSQAGGV